MIRPPSRYRKLYAGPNIGALLHDFYPEDTIEVNGESFYKNELAAIARTLEMKLDQFTQVEAFVRVEPDNEFDSNAVAVYIHEQKVGYVNKQEAPAISKSLAVLGGSAWVMAGVKHVVGLGQYRVRLMAYKPLLLDPRAFPFIDISDLKPLTYKFVDEDFESLNRISWRTELIAPGIEMHFAGPRTVLLECIDDERGGSSVAMYGEGRLLATFRAGDYPEIFDAVLEMNQKAWASIALTAESPKVELKLFFVGTEGSPAISSITPENPWPDQDDPFDSDGFNCGH
jgi:hypothetical protein